MKTLLQELGELVHKRQMNAERLQRVVDETLDRIQRCLSVLPHPPTSANGLQIQIDTSRSLHCISGRQKLSFLMVFDREQKDVRIKDCRAIIDIEARFGGYDVGIGLSNAFVTGFNVKDFEDRLRELLDTPMEKVEQWWKRDDEMRQLNEDADLPNTPTDDDYDHRGPPGTIRDNY